MADDYEDALRSMRLVRERHDAMASAVQNTALAVGLQGFLQKPANQAIARSIEAVLLEMKDDLGNLKTQLSSDGASVQELNQAMELLRLKAAEHKSEQKKLKEQILQNSERLKRKEENLEESYLTKIQELENEKTRLHTAFGIKVRDLEEESERVRIERAQLKYDQDKFKGEQAGISLTLQKTNSNHATVSRLKRHLEAQEESLGKAITKAKQDAKQFKSGKDGANAKMVLWEQTAADTAGANKTMTETAGKMSESTTTMKQALAEITACRTKYEQTATTDAAEIARLKSELETNQAEAEKQRVGMESEFRIHLTKARYSQAAAEGALKRMDTLYERQCQKGERLQVGAHNAERRRADDNRDALGSIDRLGHFFQQGLRRNTVVNQDQMEAQRKIFTDTNTALTDLKAEVNRFNGVQGQLQASVTDLSKHNAEVKTSSDSLKISADGMNTEVNRFTGLQGQFDTSVTDLRKHTGEVKTSSESLKTSADGMDTSVTSLRTEVNRSNGFQGQLHASVTDLSNHNGEVKTSSDSMNTSMKTLQTMQIGLEVFASDFKKAHGSMKELAAGVKTALDLFTKNQQTILSNDDEARAAITSMDSMRWQLFETRDKYSELNKRVAGKIRRTNELHDSLDVDREQLDEETRNFNHLVKDLRSEFERERGELKDEWEVYHAMVASIGQPDDFDDVRFPKRRCSEDLQPSPKRLRFELTQEAGEDSRMEVGGVTLVERTSPSNADLPVGIFDEQENLFADDDLVVDLDETPHPATDADPVVTLETADATPEIVATVPPPVVTTSVIPAPVVSAPPQSVVDQIFELFDVPAGWIQAKQDEFHAHLQEKYHDQTFDDVKITFDKAAKDHPRFKADLKCLVFQGYKLGKSCIPKGKLNTRSNCPQHGSTDNGLCLIISKADDASPHSWAVTDRA